MTNWLFCNSNSDLKLVVWINYNKNVSAFFLSTTQLTSASNITNYRRNQWLFWPSWKWPSGFRSCTPVPGTCWNTWWVQFCRANWVCWVLPLCLQIKLFVKGLPSSSYTSSKLPVIVARCRGVYPEGSEEKSTSILGCFRNCFVISYSPKYTC